MKQQCLLGGPVTAQAERFCKFRNMIFLRLRIEQGFQDRFLPAWLPRDWHVNRASLFIFNEKQSCQRVGMAGLAHDLPLGNLQGKFVGYLVKSESEKRRLSILKDYDAR